MNASDQALVQGDVKVYGDLIINAGSLFLWGSSDGQRTMTVYSGGSLTITNGGVVSAYTSTCFNLEVNNGASLTVDDGRFQEVCEVELSNQDWSLENVHFEDARLRIVPPSSPPTQSNGISFLNWTFDNVDFANMTRRPVLALNAGGMNGWSAQAKSLEMNFTNFSIDVNMYDRGSTSTHTVEEGWYLPTTFSHGIIRDQSYANQTGGNFGSMSLGSGTTYQMFPSLFRSTGGTLKLNNVTAYDSHEHGFVYGSGIVELSDVSISGLLVPSIRSNLRGIIHNMRLTGGYT